MKMKHIFVLTLTGLGLPGVATSHEVTCGVTPGAPILSVSDFDADGTVTGKDTALLAREVGNGRYHALYDRNGDGKLDNADVTLAAGEMNAASTATDQLLAQMYQRFKHFQHVSSVEEISAMGYQQFGSALAGHGVHWLNTPGIESLIGLKPADPQIAEGLNVMSDGSSIPALFWAQGAVPLFTDPAAPTGLSTLDWPNPGGAWETQRVQAFASPPPDFFPDTDADQWHTHAGLCLTVQDLGSGPQWLTNQHTSYAECQAMPNLMPFEFNGQIGNPWGNFWMLHAWLFDLNPHSVFANTHPCVDPDGQSEDEINGGREVPPFFHMHH